MRPERILILGGTAEARELASMLVAQGCDVTTALAGATEAPLLPAGKTRIGGFGGSDGLADFLMSAKIQAVADATHPYAIQISRNAARAAAKQNIPYVRLDRPAWLAAPGDAWVNVATVNEAAAVLPPQSRVLLTVGRKEFASILMRLDVSGVLRMIEEPCQPIPKNWRLLRARPPFSFEEERRLITDESITHLITKNAGGELLKSKLEAARACGITVIMIARPAKPEAVTAASVQALATLLLA